MEGRKEKRTVTFMYVLNRGVNGKPNTYYVKGANIDILRELIEGTKK